MSQGRLYFGGSFNPIHFGHLRCAEAVARNANFDQVTFVPSGISPHKAGQNDMVTATDRLTMCRLAVEGHPLYAVSDVEACRGGISYTIDTIRQLKAQGEHVVSWLIGADMLQILPSWRAAEQLLAEANLVVMARPGFEIDWLRLPAAFRHLREHLVEAPLIDISATEIRRRCRAGETIDGLTPPAVVQYIEETSLYR
jgi:nicotinate-nucleotide adenylyltransferase